jgi:hypothetical protein
MKFRLLDLLWITTLTGCLLGWYVDRARQASELQRSIELMRIYKNACVSNDAMYRREAAEFERQYRALRAMADSLERRLASQPDDTLKDRQHD